MMARILLIDDEVPVRLALTALLSSDGHTVSCASNGRSALRLVPIEAFRSGGGRYPHA